MIRNLLGSIDKKENNREKEHHLPFHSGPGPRRDRGEHRVDCIGAEFKFVDDYDELEFELRTDETQARTARPDTQENGAGGRYRHGHEHDRHDIDVRAAPNRSLRSDAAGAS